MFYRGQIIIWFGILFIGLNYSQAQTEWLPNDAYFFYDRLATEFGVEFQEEPSFEIHNPEILNERLDNACLMLSSSYSRDQSNKLLQGCFGLNQSGELVRVGGIQYRESLLDFQEFKLGRLPIRLKSHPGTGFYSYFVADSFQTGVWQLPGNSIILMGQDFHPVDTISIEEDQEFWNDRYPQTWAPTVFDSHEWDVGSIGENVYLFAIVVYRDSIQISAEPPTAIHIQRQAIAAYKYEPALGDSRIVDILELDTAWNVEFLVPGDDPHHTNEIDVTQDGDILSVTFSNRSVSNIYKVSFDGEHFMQVDYIVGDTFPTNGVELPFLGNAGSEFPLWLPHGSELIKPPGQDTVEYLYTYNNGFRTPFPNREQAVSYAAIEIIHDSILNFLPPFERVAPSGLPVYSLCCGGTEQVLVEDGTVPIIAMERGLSGWLAPSGLFTPLLEDEYFEPMISLQIPPPFSGDSAWGPILDIYPPEGYNPINYSNSISVISYDRLPTSRQEAVKYWYSDGQTSFTHTGAYLWQLDSNQIAVNQDTISIPGILSESEINERLEAFVRDSLFLWPLKGGFEEVQLVGSGSDVIDKDLWEFYPNPIAELIYIKWAQPLGRKFRIYSLTGSLISEGMLNPGINVIDFSSHPKGAYLISVAEGGTRLLVK